jgi:O-antigen/teichoic acid export membrane protein
LSLVGTVSISIYDRGRARRSLIDTVAFRLVSQVATVLGYVILVRGLSRHDFGVFNLLYSFIPLIGTVASLGLEQTLRRFQPEYLRQGQRNAAAWLVKRVAAARFGTNLIIIALLLATWNFTAPRFGLVGYKTPFEVFAVIALLHFQCQVLQLSMASYMMHRYSVGSVAALSFGKLIWYGSFAAFGLLSLRTAICADAIAYLFIYVMLRILYKRKCLAGLTAEPYSPPSEERKRLFRYGLFNNFNDAGTLFLDSRIDNFFIVAIMDTVSVGIYSFYVRLNEMAINVMPVRLFDNIIQPLFFAVQRHEADSKLPQYFTFLVNINLLLQMPILAYTIVYHAAIVHVVFGGKFIEYSWLLPVILGFSTLNCFSTPATLVAQFEEKAHIQLLSKIFAVYNVVAMLLLIPRWHLFGAAFASGSAQLLKNAFIWWFVRRRAVWLNAVPSFIHNVLLWGITVAICSTLKNTIAVPPLAHLLIGAVIFCLVSLLYLRGPSLCPTDRALLLRLFPGREVKVLRFLGLLQPAVDVSRAH